MFYCVVDVYVDPVEEGALDNNQVVKLFVDLVELVDGLD